MALPWITRTTMLSTDPSRICTRATQSSRLELSQPLPVLNQVHSQDPGYDVIHHTTMTSAPRPITTNMEPIQSSQKLTMMGETLSMLNSQNPHWWLASERFSTILTDNQGTTGSPSSSRFPLAF